MSRSSKILLIFAGFSFLFFAIPRYFLGGWENFLFIPLGLFILTFGVAVARDFRLFLEFFTLKTTKHGMNMGVMILLTLVLLVTINYLGAHFFSSAKLDWTKEKLNSLSDQSLQVLKSLDSDLEVKFFYGKGNPEAEAAKARFRSIMRLYEDKSKFVKLDFISSIQRPDLAEEFKVDSGDYAIFLRYKGHRQRVEKFDDEEGITTAILKVTKTQTKTVYFITGHGERDIASAQPNGLQDFKKALEDNQYQVKTLKLFEEPKIPSDAAVVMVVGPQQAYLEPELDALRQYARQGGKLLLALDPGQRHNLANLTKTFGVEFQNNYIIDPIGIMAARNMFGVVIGSDYTRTNELTKAFSPNMATLFYLASSLKRAPDAPPTFKIDEAVKTGDKALTSNELPKPGFKIDQKTQGSQTVIMTVSGVLPAEIKKGQKVTEDNSKKPEFSAVIVGDSDFMTNQLLYQQLNRDLALNSVAYLAKDNDLITIRPKVPTGTMLTLTQYQRLGLLLGYLVLTLMLFITGGAIWFRRKFA